MQINLQHSRVATANLMQVTEEESIDILSIQEPYILQNNATGCHSNIEFTQYLIHDAGQP